MYVVVERFAGSNGGFEYVLVGPIFSRAAAEMVVKSSEAEEVTLATLGEVDP